MAILLLLALAVALGLTGVVLWGAVRVAKYAACELHRFFGFSPAPLRRFFSPAHFENQSTFKISKPVPVLTLTSFQKMALLLGAILFDFLFWQQIQGLNLLLWLLVLSGFLVGENPEALRSPYFRVALLATLFSGSCAVWYGSGVAKLATWVSLALLVGWANQPQLRLLTNALLTAGGKLGRAVVALARSLGATRLGGATARSTWYYGRLLGLPLGALVVFHVLFVVANPRYAALADALGRWLETWLARLLAHLSVLHGLFFLLGLSLTAGALLRIPFGALATREGQLGEFLRRARLPRRVGLASSPLALRREYLIALGAFGLLNALLAVVNAIDVQWLWLGFHVTPQFDLAQFVHEGTSVLILSILLAMALVLFFFRRNLNFFPERGQPWLRLLATAWVLQNAVLAVSVGLRNYYYISHMGLAYKRIGVYAFLGLVGFGLATVLLKIWQRRSSFALVRLNGWAAYAVLLLLAAGNWEVWIARYNLQPRFRASLDREFLLAMPPRVLPELLRHETAFTTAAAPEISRQQLVQRTHAFLDAYARRNWPSWNYADWQAYRYLTRAGGPALVQR